MKLLAAFAVFASATLTTLGAVVLVIIGGIGVTAFIMAFKLKRAVNDLEAVVGEQALKIAEITGHITGS